MNRFLRWFNFLGVLVLLGLCVVQWQANRRMQVELIRVDRAHREQESRLDQHLKTNEGQAQDLSRLQGHLSRLTGELEQTASQLAAAERQASQYAAQCEQLKSSVTNWAAAVAARDAQLRQNAAQLKQLAEARNAAVRQFNDLVGRYHQLETNLEAWRQRSIELTTNSARLPRQP
ncbi:MAG TPA: hypothetical protein P5205_03315 [Candidatus Paceibacterota bacterium]|nr:hypothetical protein [Verrucomicrobiota bacterium]HSA09379.1 hypothetical protein [Candidatus Paceibacterota bacterium]